MLMAVYFWYLMISMWLVFSPNWLWWEVAEERMGELVPVGTMRAER